MAASPSFAINGASANTKVSIAVGGTLQAILSSIDGIRSAVWTVTRTDDTSVAATITAAIVQSGSVGQQADIAAPDLGGAGTCGILSCTVNSGINSLTGELDATLTQTVKWYVPSEGGLEVLAVGELDVGNRESDATFGAVVPLNAIIRDGAPAFAYKAANEAITTDTGFSDDDSLLSVLKVGTYALELNVRLSSDATPAFKWRVAASGGLAVSGIWLGSVATTVAADSIVRGNSSVALLTSHPVPTATTADFFLQIAGTAVVTTAGTLNFQWAQATSDAATTTVHAGSFMKATKIA